MDHGATMRRLFDLLSAGDIDVLVDGDKAVSRTRLTGTNDGSFMGVPATDRNVSIQLIDIIRWGADGLGHEHWGVMDMMALMQQIGAVPAGPPA